jgi:hypothetical protein
VGEQDGIDASPRDVPDAADPDGIATGLGPDPAAGYDPADDGPWPTAGPDRAADGPLRAPAPGDACPFLAAIDIQDRLRPASLTPDTANRCLSTGEPVAPTARDQAALCLSGEQAACPRFVRATRGVRADAPIPAHGPRISAPIAAAGAVVALAALLAGVSLAAEGDLSVGLGGASSSAPAATAGAAGPAASSGGSVAAASLAPATPAATPVPTPAPSVASPTPASTPAPKPKKYAGLTACPGVDDCYIYVVKRGDTLAAVAARYGLTLDEVLARNPKIRDPGLIVLGQKIRMPTPRR